MAAPHTRHETRLPEWPAASADATGDAASGVHDGGENAPGRAPPGGPVTVTGSVTPDGATLPLSPELFARVAKALADPRRFSILEMIAAHGEIACQRLCCHLPVKQATVSHHVKELALAGLVETRRDGQFVYYRYQPDVMRQYLATLSSRMQLDA